MLPLAARLAEIVALLRAAVGAHIERTARGAQPVWLGTQAFVPVAPPGRRPPLPHPVWTLLWHRLQRLADRFARLHARWQQGALPPRRAPRPGRAARPPGLRLPRALGWVNHRVAESAPPTGMLDALLREREPELRRFLAEAPQAGRLLRPLCRALGVPQPKWLRLPPRPRAPRPPPAPLPGWPGGRRPRSHPHPLLPTDPPLPGYVLRAVRAWRNNPA